MSDAWAVAICSVLFDLDVGQRIDSIYPEGALTEEEANDVAFHSFPVSTPHSPPSPSRAMPFTSIFIASQPICNRSFAPDRSHLPVVSCTTGLHVDGAALQEQRKGQVCR